MIESDRGIYRGTKTVPEPVGHKQPKLLKQDNKNQKFERIKHIFTRDGKQNLSSYNYSNYVLRQYKYIPSFVLRTYRSFKRPI